MYRILAVRQDNNGDVTLLGPAVRALAERSSVVLACAPSGEGAAALLPGVDEIVTIDAGWIAAKPAPIDAERFAADVARYAALNVDEAFIFTSFHQSPLPTALMLRLAGIVRIAAISVDYPGSLLDTRVVVDENIHEVERALALVGARGYQLPPSDDGRLRYRQLPPRLDVLPTHYVAVQPGATVPARMWAPAKMAALVAMLENDDVRVVVVGSESERELGAQVCGASGALDLTGRTTYPEFASVVRDASALVVGNSSGIHVASAMATPVVSIFPPTILPRRFAPWRTPAVVLGNHGITCAGCRATVCRVPEQPCIGDVDPREVVSALRSLGAGAPSIHSLMAVS